MQLPTSPEWTEIETFTNSEFRELKEQALNENCPYYVFARNILMPLQTGISCQSNVKFYDGISYYKYAKQQPNNDPSTRRTILATHYFAVRTMLVSSNKIVPEVENKVFSFPPNIYNLTDIISNEGLNQYAFSAVNFFAKSPKTIGEINKVRELLSCCFLCKAVKLENSSMDENDRFLKNLYMHEALLWKIAKK
jgi:hypothetical protein